METNASSAQVDSQSSKRRNYRKWTMTEDHILVSCMVELHRDGTYNADTGFKPGYLNELEKKFEKRMPNSGLKAKPHIESRVKTLRKDWNTVYDMIYGSKSSGFGWDASRKIVIAEDPVWDAYIVTHKDAAPFRSQSLWYFEDFCFIYAKDHGTNKDAPATKDVLEEMATEEGDNKEENVEEHELHDVVVSMSETREGDSGKSEHTSTKRKKLNITRKDGANNHESSINASKDVLKEMVAEEGGNKEENVEEHDKKENIEEHESHTMQAQLGLDDVDISMSKTRGGDSRKSECTSTKRKKVKISKRDGANDNEFIINAAMMIGNGIKEMGKEICKSMGMELMINEQLQKLDVALGEIDGLREEERDIALSKIPDYPRQLLVFFSLPPHRRLKWVRRFIYDH